jgi:hypothetical protein
MASRSRTYKAAHAEQVLTKRRTARAENGDALRQQARDLYAVNRERELARRAEYRVRHPDKVQAAQRAWQQRNRHVKCAAQVARQEWTKRATPAWADVAAIRSVYAEAARLTAETGVRHEVDHFYPLRSKVVCGLHVDSNLCVTTATNNRRKGNMVPLE